MTDSAVLLQTNGQYIHTHTHTLKPTYRPTYGLKIPFDLGWQ